MSRNRFKGKRNERTSHKYTKKFNNEYNSSRYKERSNDGYSKQKDSIKEIFPGVLLEIKKGRKTIFTLNLNPGKKVYIEKLIDIKGKEYREWIPKRSKLGAGIMKGIPTTGLNSNSKVLYLGAASGTTVSHVSDIAKDGFVFALDFAPRVVRDLVYLAEERHNIAPILADANKPETFFHQVAQVDLVFQDIAQSNQSEIFLKNVRLFLKKDGTAILALKARSVDVTKKPKEIFDIVKKELQKELKVIDYRTLEPFEKDHCIFVCKKQ